MANTLTPHQQKRRQSILETVRKHLAQQGYGGLSMRDVADSAGVSPTTLYNLYDNKDGLVLAALQDILDNIGEQVARTNTSGVELLIAQTRIIGETTRANPEYASAMARMLFNSDPADPVAIIMLKNQMDAQLSILEQMRSAGEIRRDVDLSGLARILVGNSWSANLLWLKGMLALKDLPRESVTITLSTLFPVMTPRTRRRYQDLLELAAR